MRLRSGRILIVPLILLLWSSMLFAGTTGKIAGVVRTTDGELLPGANIIVTGQIVNGKEVGLSSVSIADCSTP